MTQRVSARVPSTVRENILGTCATVLRDFGALHLNQPRIAKLSGVRQGHMTYYFPLKSDLIRAVIDRAMGELDEDLRVSSGRSVRGFFVDPSRVRTLLGLVVHADADKTAQTVLAGWLTSVQKRVAHACGRSDEGPGSEFALALLLGLGVLDLAHGRTLDPEQIRARHDHVARWACGPEAP